jgi:hypothetical protein
MSVRGLGGADAVAFTGLSQADSAHETRQAQPAQVSRTPLTARPDPTRVASGGTSPEPLKGKPGDFLTNKAEREAYAFVTNKERPLSDLLDRFDGLSPASYNRVLHALCLTRSKTEPSALDKLVLRGGTEPGKAKLAERFLKQVANKLTGQPGKIMGHLAPETRARLETYPGWARIQGTLP